MSYASVAAHNAPPPSQQPHPDQALLTTEPPSQDNIADDMAKVNIVSSDFKQHPATTTSTADVPIQPTPQPVSGGVPPATRATGGSGHGGGRSDKAKRYLHEAEEEGLSLYHTARSYLLRPGVAGGLIGVANIGLLSWAGYAFYQKPHLRRDYKVIASAAAAALTLLGAEGYAAEKYRETPAGQEEERRARQEGAALYRYSREHLLRPGVLGGLVGVVNTAVIGAIGYFAYKHWDAPRWDKRVVSAVSAGLLTLWTGEGYLAEQYKQTHH